MIIWIVSYPKSGNTWVRSFLSAYYYSKDGDFNFKLLKNIEQYPQKKFLKKSINKPADISSYWKTSQEEIIKNKEIKFFKTHNSLLSINGNDFTSEKYTLGAIYIIRDPRNVVTSLKNHFALNYEESLKFMLNERKFIHDQREKDYSDFHFLSSWSNHYKSWLNEKSFRKIIIKYEDLEKNTYKTFEELVTFINSLSNIKKKISKKIIQNCIESTSLEKLKQKEKISGFSESITSNFSNKKIDFFHLGPKNKWEKILPIELHEKINKTFEKDLKFFKYI